MPNSQLPIAAAVPPRSMLFVSGEKPERFAKAMAAGADVVCIDLEDAVAPERKALARSEVLRWIAERTPEAGQPAVALRLNAVRTLEGLRDVLALSAAGSRPDWLLLPKVEAAADLHCIQAWLGTQCPPLVALIETPGAVADAMAIARAGGSTAALMLGAPTWPPNSVRNSAGMPCCMRAPASSMRRVPSDCRPGTCRTST